ERFRRLQQATGGPDLERGFYCCSLNKYLRFPERTELARTATLQSYLAAHCVEGKPRAPSRVGCLSGVKINEQSGSSVAVLNQFVTEVRSASILLDVAYLRARNDGTRSHIQRRQSTRVVVFKGAARASSRTSCHKGW